jgi:hypothetical protein
LYMLEKLWCSCETRTGCFKIKIVLQTSFR